MATPKLTAEQYFRLGEDPPGVHLELIDGEIIVDARPDRRHAEIIVDLAYLLETHLRKHKLGKLYLDTDVVFNDHTVRRPDIAYFNRALLSAMTSDRLTLSPNLCIEVLSPSNADDDRINKFDLYQSAGVQHYWIFDPEAEMAEAYALRDGVYTLAASGAHQDVVHLPPFVDLAISLGELWKISF